VRGIVKKPVAGKSGTTDGEKTASLVVMTKQLAMAGILADPDWAETTQDMGHDVRGGVNPPVYQALRDAMKGKKSIEFTPPSGKIVTGDQRSIPNVKCQSLATALSRVKGAGFVAEVGGKVDSSCPAGTAAGTSPDDRTIKGGPVTIEVSSGKPPAGGPRPGR
jgi:hypothetical protein